MNDTWTQSLKWQRITPYEKFAAMLDRHWESIAAYCHPENKVSLGLVEGIQKYKPPSHLSIGWRFGVTLKRD